MNVLLFGIAREIAGTATLDAPDLETVAALKAWLQERYPALGELRSLAVAVDRVYAEDGDAIPAGAEIALIPPVSGG